jgi:uncharacterized membrane protein YdfJ with MMPL/SSD domain
MNKIAVCTVALLAILAGPAHAQAPASSAVKSDDPVVQTRMKRKEASRVYDNAVASARNDRDAKVKAAVDSAVKDATATGKDPIVAKRNATSAARKATKADYDAAVRAAKKERDAAYAAAGKTTTSKATP